MKIILSEYDAFKRMTDGLDMCIDGAKAMAMHRPEHRNKWLKMAEVYAVCKESIWKIAEETSLEDKS